MLKRLRTKFIALNMAMATLVLVVALVAICIVSFQQHANDVYDELDSSIAQSVQQMRSQKQGDSMPFDGAFPTFGEEDAEEASSSQGQEGTEQSDDMKVGVPPEIGGKDSGGAVIPVMVCEVEDDGGLAVISSATTATIAEAVLEEAAQMLSTAEDGHGRLDGLGLLYSKRTSASGTLVAFADEGSLSGWKTFALTLAIMGVAVLVAFFAIAVFFSRWAFRPVEETWRKQRQFVADASHELKTPLTVILANVSILREHPERTVSSQSQWLESTQQEAERMQGLVGDLLTLARLDADGEKTVHADVDLSELAESEVLQFESVAYERSVELIADIESGVVVLGDGGRLRRLVATLLDNACKYADADSPVTVSLHTEGKNAVLRVRNTGVAIPREDLDRVFDRFFRADKARARGVGGFGLGLAIAREIVEEHKGAIGVESDETETTFSVRLPVR